jgi:hypothetical protein
MGRVASILPVVVADGNLEVTLDLTEPQRG